MWKVLVPVKEGMASSLLSTRHLVPTRRLSCAGDFLSLRGKWRLKQSNRFELHTLVQTRLFTPVVGLSRCKRILCNLELCVVRDHDPEG